MKKMRIFNVLIVAFLLTNVFVACHKYEDGPTLSLRTKNNRLKGFWMQTDNIGYRYFCFATSEDCLDYYQNENTDKIIGWKETRTVYWFRDKNNLTEFEISLLYLDNNDYDTVYGSGSVDYCVLKDLPSFKINDSLFYTSSDVWNLTGDWDWIDGKESLSLTFGDDSYKWDILRLTENKIVIENDPYGKFYFSKAKINKEDDFIDTLGL